jgi:hypothetical protein
VGWFVGLRLHEGSWHPGAPRAQPFAERLCLCVQAQRRGGAGPEQSSDEEVDRAEVGDGSFEDLNASYVRLEEAGIEPAFCVDHGMTLSYSYRDPDGNHVELQVDNFGDWAKSSAHMRETPELAADPIGKFVDPARVAEAAAAGAFFAEIHGRGSFPGKRPSGRTATT